MTGAGEGGERNYYCGAGHLVLITAATGERVRGVYCRECRARVTVNLEGRAEARKPPAASGVATVGDPALRANPPIETARVRPARGRG